MCVPVLDIKINSLKFKIPFLITAKIQLRTYVDMEELSEFNCNLLKDGRKKKL